MRHLRFCLLALCFAVPLAAQPEHVKAYEAKVFKDSSGGTLPYRLFRPADYDPSQSYPLVIYLHGAGGRGDDNLKQMTGGNAWGLRLFSSNKVQAKHTTFVLAPQTATPWLRDRSKMEPAGEPIDLVVNLIDSLGAEFNLDSKRIYVTGQSMGGYGSWGAVTRYTDLFAAAAPICGGGVPSAASRIKVPIWAFHGAADKTVPPEQSRLMIEALKAAGAKPRYTEYSGVGHNSWENAYSDPELVEWLFTQRRP